MPSKLNKKRTYSGINVTISEEDRRRLYKLVPQGSRAEFLSKVLSDALAKIEDKKPS